MSGRDSLPFSLTSFCLLEEKERSLVNPRELVFRESILIDGKDKSLKNAMASSSCAIQEE